MPSILSCISTETISLKRKKLILNLTDTIICDCSTFIAVFMVEASTPFVGKQKPFGGLHHCGKTEESNESYQIFP